MLYSKEMLLRDQAYFTAPSGTATHLDDAAVLQSRISELETEVGILRNQLGQAKGINDLMWETVVQKVVHGQVNNGNPELGDERRRKRGRIDLDLTVHSPNT